MCESTNPSLRPPKNRWNLRPQCFDVVWWNGDSFRATKQPRRNPAGVEVWSPQQTAKVKHGRQIHANSSGVQIGCLYFKEIIWLVVEPTHLQNII